MRCSLPGTNCGVQPAPPCSSALVRVRARVRVMVRVRVRAQVRLGLGSASCSGGMVKVRVRGAAVEVRVCEGSAHPQQAAHSCIIWSCSSPAPSAKPASSITHSADMWQRRWQVGAPRSVAGREIQVPQRVPATFLIDRGYIC